MSGGFFGCGIKCRPAIVAYLREEEMKSLMCSLVLFFAACGVCNAQQVVKQEPPVGQPPGEKFLVDDGTCGRGKIKELTIADWNSRGVNADVPRKRRSIARR